MRWAVQCPTTYLEQRLWCSFVVAVSYQQTHTDTRTQRERSSPFHATPSPRCPLCSHVLSKRDLFAPSPCHLTPSTLCAFHVFSFEEISFIFLVIPSSSLFALLSSHTLLALLGLLAFVPRALSMTIRLLFVRQLMGGNAHRGSKNPAFGSSFRVSFSFNATVFLRFEVYHVTDSRHPQDLSVR